MKYRPQELLVKSFESSKVENMIVTTVNPNYVFTSTTEDLQGRTSLVFACEGGALANGGTWFLEGSIDGNEFFVMGSSPENGTDTSIFFVETPFFRFYRVRYSIAQADGGGLNPAGAGRLTRLTRSVR